MSQIMKHVTCSRFPKGVYTQKVRGWLWRQFHKPQVFGPTPIYYQCNACGEVIEEQDFRVAASIAQALGINK